MQAFRVKIREGKFVPPTRPVGCRNSSASGTNGRTRFEFAPFADAGMLTPMNSSFQNSANPLIAKVQQLFSHDLALENDFLRQENKILRSKLGARTSFLNKSITSMTGALSRP